MAAYQAALEGAETPFAEVKAARSSPARRTMGAAISLYYASSDWQGLSETTKVVYRGILEAFRKVHGERLVAELEPQHLRRLLAAKAATPHAANRLRKVLRNVLRLTVEDGWRRDDPTLSVRTIKAPSEGIHTWSETEIEAFEKHWQIDSKPRLAMALLLYTGQRRGDVVKMGRQHLRDGRISVVQQKTGARLEIPVDPRLMEIIAASPGDRLTFLLTDWGKPFTAAGFGNWFREKVDAAGLPPECSSHGLRKAAARRLAEAGCSTHEIMSITGHRSLKEVERYTRAADQTRLASQAIIKVLGRRDSEQV